MKRMFNMRNMKQKFGKFLTRHMNVNQKNSSVLHFSELLKCFSFNTHLTIKKKHSKVQTLTQKFILFFFFLIQFHLISFACICLVTVFRLFFYCCYYGIFLFCCCFISFFIQCFFCCCYMLVSFLLFVGLPSMVNG